MVEVTDILIKKKKETSKKDGAQRETKPLARVMKNKWATADSILTLALGIGRGEKTGKGIQITRVCLNLAHKTFHVCFSISWCLQRVSK